MTLLKFEAENPENFIIFLQRAIDKSQQKTLSSGYDFNSYTDQYKMFKTESAQIRPT